MSPLSSAAYVTAVLRFLQAYNSDDLDDCLNVLDPDVEWHTAIEHKGREQVRAYLEALRGRYNDPQARPEDFREAGGYVLMVVTFFDGQPGPDYSPAEERQSWITQVGEDGTLRRIVTYPTPAEAARALESISHRVPA
jgi:ketosteroid isomerase-like protein